MFEVLNRTPFPAALVPGLDKDDVAHLTVLVKGTFTMPIDGKPVARAEEQVPIRWSDEFNGPDPATSSVRNEADACPAKPGTDVVLIGHAYAGARRLPTIDVGFRVGSIQKIVRVTGERRWTRAAFAWTISSPPVPFDRMPLVYERAFGGIDRSDRDPARQGGDDRNPVGAGFALAARKERLEGLPLPNIEDPKHPVTDWNSRPPVAGFGFVARGWMPRRKLAGTYDKAWMENRSPLLPADFDPRFFNGAPADQIATPHLRGGEPVKLINVSPSAPTLAFELPQVPLSFQLDMDMDMDMGVTSEAAVPVMDTVVLDPDHARFVLCWRSTVRLGRRLRQVKRVVVRTGTQGRRP